MKLCLKCYCLWPRDAAFCGRCRRALGAKRCPKGHANPFLSPAATCLTCNEGPLDGVPCLPLGCVAPLLSLLLLVGLWRWAWHHPGVAISACWRAFLWAMGVLFDTAPGRVGLAVRQGLAWYVALWLLSYLLPQAAGRSARQFLKALPGRAARGLGAAWRFLLPLALRPIRGARTKAVASRQKDGDAGSD